MLLKRKPNKTSQLKRYHFLSLIPFFLMLACGKEPLINNAPSLVGDWQHYQADEQWDFISIDENGIGYVQWYTNGKLFQETKIKEWFVKDNTLFLGKVTFSFKPYSIDLYPTTVNFPEIVGFDTLDVGDVKIELNQRLFKKVSE